MPTRNSGRSKPASESRYRSQPAARKGAAKSRRAHGSHITTDHDEIRQWVESRGGHPACVKRVGGKDDPGLLRIDFPDGEEPSLQEISWDEFFEKFDEKNLEFLYQDETAGGKKSRFNKLISRQTAEAGGRFTSRSPAKKSRSTASRSKPGTRRAGGH